MSIAQHKIVPRCHIPWQQMVIDSTGAAAPCCYWGAYENVNLPIGNVKETSIEEIWNSEGYQKLRAGMASGDLKAAGCAKCHAVKQGMALGFDYDAAADDDDVTPHGKNIKILKSRSPAARPCSRQSRPSFPIRHHIDVTSAAPIATRRDRARPRSSALRPPTRLSGWRHIWCG